AVKDMHISGARYGKEVGPHAVLHVHEWRALRRLATGGNLGFSKSYIEGEWDSPELEKVTEMAARNGQSLKFMLLGNKLVRKFQNLRHRARDNSRDQARDNISYHYDISNEFYASWLDPSMTYSSAVFAEGDDLEAAQYRKYARLLERMDVKRGDHILEIGCGWGGFAEVAARDWGANVTGITLSERQLDFARERIARAGLSDKVTFKLVDYRDVQGEFDHIASIEMFEAVGESYWPGYFDSIARMLKPGGRVGLQFISIDDKLFETYRRGADFIQTYIFPGGMLPPVDRVRALSTDRGLNELDHFAFGKDYARTLRIWRERFEAALKAGQIAEEFDERFQRIWRLYLAYCEGGFNAETINVRQMVFENSRS
ncbi:MAG: cyclopropane-fatty-acyl-phospholipid synthase family protein, partial [Pseudomonadota bacterium]